jgi:hypothetical protein
MTSAHNINRQVPHLICTSTGTMADDVIWFTQLFSTRCGALCPISGRNSPAVSKNSSAHATTDKASSKIPQPTAKVSLREMTLPFIHLGALLSAAV